MRIAFLNWRDLSHPEGGGAERYAQTVCAGLAARGHEVVFFCARHDGAPAAEVRDGYRIRRAGGRAGVYPRSLMELRRDERDNGPFHVVIDTQNGLPFWSPLATGAPVVSLIHHVHREQWPVVFGPVMARLGWFLESHVAPRVYRRHTVVTVSDRSRDELLELGYSGDVVRVIHNGTDRAIALGVPRSEHPTMVVLGRLVPHKRVELAVDVLARLRGRHPGLELRVVGDGWWRHKIEEHADHMGVAGSVRLLGYVDEVTKHRELSRAWIALAPSAKEGWGLNVVEAASHGVPTIAHHGAGGLSESIVDGVTGLLVDDVDGLTVAADALLRDSAARDALGSAAEAFSHRYSWDGAVNDWEDLLFSLASPVQREEAQELSSREVSA